MHYKKNLFRIICKIASTFDKKFSINLDEVVYHILNKHSLYIF